MMESFLAMSSLFWFLVVVGVVVLGGVLWYMRNRGWLKLPGDKP